ncbi:hypothetical protein ACK335_03295 [Aeromonas veronii]
MKRYDCEWTPLGAVMEEHKEGAFVPFSEVSGLAEQLADATRQCGVMADLLREAIGEVPQTQSFPSRCDAALAGKLPDRQDTEWTDATTSPVAADYRELQEQHDQLQSKYKDARDLLQESHEMMRRIIPPMPQGLANRSDLLDRIEAALAGQFTLPAWYLDGAKDFKSMMLDASTALFHPHIEGVFAVFERRLALDDQPQGGEPCAIEPRSSSQA